MDDSQHRPSRQDAASAGALIGRAHLLGERLDLRGLEQEKLRLVESRRTLRLEW